MPDIQLLGQLGAVGLAMLAVVFSLDLLRKKYRESDRGDRRRAPVIMDCPNKIQGLDATLEEVAKQARASTQALAACAITLNHNRDGIDKLVTQHAPEGGREQWKIPARMESLQEETVVLLRELVVIAKKNGGK